MSDYKFISDEPDYRHLEDKERYKNLYEEVGMVEANKVIKWREEWMKYFTPKPNSTILELGSHNGPNLLKYAREGFQIDGVELSQSLIDTFKTNLTEESNEVQTRINLYKSWIEEFSTEKKYDYVLVTEVLEHVIDPVKILKTAEKHLESNGIVYISSPSTHWGNNTHVRGVPKDDLVSWLEKAELLPVKIWIEDERTFCYAIKKKVDSKIYGLIRVRNEEKIIQDSLDHLEQFCTGGIFVYDDCSTDNTPSICEKHPSVKKVIRGKSWDKERARAEFENRAAILHEAKKAANENDWFVYIDADERIEYDWSNLYNLSSDVIGIRMRLFDFYITPEDVNEPYYNRKYIGPEYRDILIAFRNLPTLRYDTMDQREVTLGKEGKVLNEGYVRHYGKAISVEEWEKTCDYYSKHFPMYSEKWEKRRGKAVHYKYSDFGNELITWDEKEKKGIDLYEFQKVRTPSEIMKSNTNPEFLNVLVTNHHFLDYQGTELFTLNLIETLTSLGHKVTLYTKYIDKFREKLEKKNIKVVTDLELIKEENFHIAHVHHNILALEVRYYFPQLPIVFMSHGVIPFLEQPPVLGIGIAKYLAVSEEVKGNLISKGVEGNKIEIFRNKINPYFFWEQNPINEIPRKALVISNKIDSTTEKIIRDACSLLEIHVEFIGKRFRKVSPEVVVKIINDSDIVFTLGRGVIETMLCGIIPIIFDSNGGDGIVLPENVKQYMKRNFSGRTNNKIFTVNELVQEIKKYDYKNGKILKEIANELFSSESMHKIIDLYKKTISENSKINCGKTELNIIEMIIKAAKETKHYEQVKAGKEILDVKIDYAEFLIENDQLVKAKELLENMAAENKENLDVQNDLAVIAIMEERYEEAKDIIRGILDIDQTNEIAFDNYQFIKEMQVAV